MGGDITVSSEPGRGSLFQCDVQVGLADAAELAATGPGRRVVGLAPDPQAPDGKPFRLLVVEDRENNRRLLVRLLESLGFEVQEAENGQVALEVWERWQPHLIWMDMRMPVLDGYEATRRIKATPQGQDTIIVALTASAFEEDRAAILAEGCDDFVRKPIREAAIFDTLAKHLDVRFVYEVEGDDGLAPEGGEREAEGGVRQDTLSMALAAMSSQWVDDMRQAVTDADLERISTLIDQVRERDASAANALEELIHDFEYDEILRLIAQAANR
jgi:CheY-like chemotaxis protein